MTGKRKPSRSKRRDPLGKTRAPTRKKAPPPEDPEGNLEDLPPEVAAAFETWMKVRGEAPGPLFLNEQGLEKLGKGLPITDADGISEEEIARRVSPNGPRSRSRVKKNKRSDPENDLEAGAE